MCELAKELYVKSNGGGSSIIEDILAVGEEMKEANIYWHVLFCIQENSQIQS